MIMVINCTHYWNIEEKPEAEILPAKASKPAAMQG